VHDDSEAGRSAEAVSALAYTVGEHIVLGPHQSGRSAGHDMWAHELAHVAQHRQGDVVPSRLPIGDVDSPGESAARKAGLTAARGKRASLDASPGGMVLQRQPKPEGADAGGKSAKDDDPTPWLTLQAQPFGQYTRIFTFPSPPPWLLGVQGALNFQFHPGKTGFELALIGQYGHVFTWSSTATAAGEQGSFILQPSFVYLNTGGNQLALFAQGGYACTSSKDPKVAGGQFSLFGGAQYTRDLFPIGPFKVQSVASLGFGGAWSKGPEDTRFSGAKAWTASVGFQVALDVVERKKAQPSPPPEKTEVKFPDQAPPKKTEDIKKQTTDEKKKPEEDAKKKVAEDAQKTPGNKTATPAPAPPPSDAKVFFLKDKPSMGPAGDKRVTADDMGGVDLKALRKEIEAALAADPSLRVSILGYASIEGPEEYNCSLGARRAEWLRAQLGIDRGRVADPTDKSVTAKNCQDDGGMVSFGSTQAVKTEVEAERKRDRFAVIHFHRK
jgi:outer membrane protein OmpA-like peptidoglycan-associated protein